MKEELKNVVDNINETTEVNEETVITPAVDNNTELESSDYNPDEASIIDTPIDEPVDVPADVPAENAEPAPSDESIDSVVSDPVTDVPAEEPVLDAPLAGIAPPVQDIPVDASVEDPTLATTDEIIPASADTVDGEPIVDPIIPEEPVELTPEVPVSNDVVPEDGCPACDNVVAGTEPCDSKITVGNYFGTIQECVTIVWRFHLKTRKHFIHVALNEFYEKALDIVDDIIEQYQGIYGVVEEPFVNCIVGDGKDEREYLIELKAFVENNKCVLDCHSEIESTIDEFLALIDSTIYKITSFTESAVKSFDEFVYEDYPAIKESCKYDRFGERSCDDPDDPDYDPEFENGECSAEEEE